MMTKKKEEGDDGEESMTMEVPMKVEVLGVVEMIVHPPIEKNDMTVLDK